MKMTHQQITTISAVTAAFAAVAGFFLAIAIDLKPVSEWEVWDALRLENKEGITLIVAKLRNDNESRYSEELLEWIDENGKQHIELGRTWERQQDARIKQSSLRNLFEHTDALVLVEGYVGPEGTVLQMWANGIYDPVVVNFRKSDESRTEVKHTLDKIVVRALQQKAAESALQMADDDEYTKIKERLKQVHQEVGTRAEKRQVNFTTAYVENIRADKKGSEEKGRRAIRIYNSLLHHPENDIEKAKILTNLGIAEFREARIKENPEAARTAIRRWHEAEQLTGHTGHIEHWIRVRNFQTEGELWIEGRKQDGKAAMQAWKRQVETLADTHTIIDELTVLGIRTWLERARQSALEGSGDACKHWTDSAGVSLVWR